MNEAERTELILRLIDGDLSRDEQRALAAELDRSPDARQQLAAELRREGLLAGLVHEDPPEAPAEWLRRAEAISAGETPQQAARVRRRARCRTAPRRRLRRERAERARWQ